MLVNSPVPIIAGAGTGQNHEPRTNSRSPAWVAEPELVEPSLATSQGTHEQEALTGSKAGTRTQAV